MKLPSKGKCNLFGCIFLGDEILMRKVLLHIPHSSITIPKEYMDDFVLNKHSLEKYNREMADLYIDELFEFEHFDSIKFDYSRLFCDVEKCLDEKKEELDFIDMGPIYSRTYDGKLLRDSSKLNKNLIVKDYYMKHHKEIDDYSIETFQNGEKLLVIDCHSFSDKMANKIFGESKNPDICIGYDEEFVDLEVVEIISRNFRDYGYSVEMNTTYKGSFVPNVVINNPKYRETTKSVMIELNKRIYLDENNSKQESDFYLVKSVLNTILNEIFMMSYYNLEFNKDKFRDYYYGVYSNIENYVKKTKDSKILEAFGKMSIGYEQLIESLEWKITNFHSFMHEIKTFKLFSDTLKLKTFIREDNNAGPDFLINENIHVECIISTFGSLEKPETHRLSEPIFGVYDPVPQKNKLLPRVTSSIKEKIEKFEGYSKVINTNEPYVIFVGLSLLGTVYNFGENFDDLLLPLLDVGDRIVYLNKKTLKYSHYDFIRNNSLRKTSGKEIPIGYFLMEELSFISAIIFTDSQFKDFYTKDNTAIFLNPLAKNPLDPKIFKGLKIYGVTKNDSQGYSYDRILFDNKK